MIYEASDTSANKTHPLNWLYDMTVQMAGVRVHVLSVPPMSICACMRGDVLGVSACVWRPMLVPVIISFPCEPEMR